MKKKLELPALHCGIFFTNGTSIHDTVWKGKDDFSTVKGAEEVTGDNIKRIISVERSYKAYAWELTYEKYN